MKLAAILAAALLAAASGVFLVSCSKSSSGGQHATLLLRDGTNVSGTVLSSSTGEIQIAGDDKITRTIPMAQVRSIQYDDAAAAPGSPASPAPPPQQTAAAPTAPPATVPAPAATEPVAPPPAENHPTEAAVTSTRHEVPAGREVSVRTEETIDSSKAVEGQTFAADITRDVSDSDGRVVIPRGSNARIVIRSVSKGGHFRGASDLVLDLASVSVDGRLYSVSTAPIEKRGNAGVGANKRTAEFGGGGAAFGAIVGAIAGGGKGAAIGAGSGAGAGALAQILTRGSIKVPVETVLTFRLDKPLWIQAAQ
ncbi:MAG TPA: hypothetical protein VKV17_06445 [Bryobacteraceae bacterium]|nr:hypothetical protein [Bryobacteraceae bacterium]